VSLACRPTNQSIPHAHNSVTEIVASDAKFTVW